MKLTVQEKLLCAAIFSLSMGAGASTLLTGCSSDPGPASGYKHLRDKDVPLLRPLMAPLKRQLRHSPFAQ